MSVLGEIFNQLNLPKEQMHNLVKKLMGNSRNVMSILQESNIPQEISNKIAEVIKSHPLALMELAKEYGIKKEGIAGKAFDFIKEKVMHK